jgi:AhpD family alkylhydroperoxidase
MCETGLQWSHIQVMQRRSGFMEARLDYAAVAPGVMKAMAGLKAYLNSTELEPPLLELVKLRASQINGCAYCVDMHSKDARAGGETEERLYTLSVWRDTPFFTPREQAALAWTEALTLLPQSHVSDDLYQATLDQFGEKGLVDLTLAVSYINAWNRFGVSFRDVPGEYQPKPKAAFEQA